MMWVIKKYIADFFLQLRNGIFNIFFANIINKLLTMFSNMMITRILTQNEYGIWSYVLNIYGYLNLLSGVGLINGAFQFGSENYGKEKEFSYYNYCLSRGLFINSIITIVYIVAIFFMDLSLKGTNSLIQIYAPIIIIEYVLNLFLTILRCESRIKEYARVLNINTVLYVISICFGAFWGIWGVLIGRYCATIISLIFIMFYTKKEYFKMKYSVSLNLHEKHVLWHYSIFIGACSLLNQASNLIDVSMIAKLISNASDISLYKVSTLIPNALNFIPYSVLTAILPNIIRHQDNKKWLRKSIPKIFLGMFIFNLTICLILYIGAPIIVTIISGSRYLESVQPFRVLVVGYFFYGTFSTLAMNILTGFKRVNYNLLISVLSLFADIIANYLMIPKFGIVGAAYATVIVILIKGVLYMLYLSWVLYFSHVTIVNNK